MMMAMSGNTGLFVDTVSCDHLKTIKVQNTEKNLKHLLACVKTYSVLTLMAQILNKTVWLYIVYNIYCDKLFCDISLLLFLLK